MVVERMRKVRVSRSQSKRKSTLNIANSPQRLNVEVFPTGPFLAVPEVSSQRREYIPIGWLEPPTIPSNKLRLMEGADLWHFAVLTSRMHMAWVRHIGGRLKSDYQYSVGLDYNAFPWPVASAALQVRTRRLAQAVLDARAQFSGATLADLYDTDTMPVELQRAHRALDAAIDRLYRPAVFNGDRERVEHLFGLYEKKTTPLPGILGGRPSKRRRG